MPSGDKSPRRASVLETIGAWLRLWTAPRDVEIPPVPWRKLAIGAAAGALVLAAGLAVMVPRIDSGKASRAQQDRAERDRVRAANHARIVRLQRPHHAAARALAPPAGADPAQRAAARARLIAHVEASIIADSLARAKAGEMRRVTGPTTCEPTPGTAVGGPIGVYDCFTVAGRIKTTTLNVPGVIGYPFRAVVDFRRFTYTWCKTEQIPGERLIPDPRTVVHLPPACRASRDTRA